MPGNLIMDRSHMLRFITEKSVLVLAALNFVIATPAMATVINYDTSVAWSEAGATVGNSTLLSEADAVAASLEPLTSASASVIARDNAAPSLLGPIPGPSLMWLLIGAIAALAGLSRGTRGIHESV